MLGDIKEYSKLHANAANEAHQAIHSLRLYKQSGHRSDLHDALSDAQIAKDSFGGDDGYFTSVFWIQDLLEAADGEDIKRFLGWAEVPFSKRIQGVVAKQVIVDAVTPDDAARKIWNSASKIDDEQWRKIFVEVDAEDEEIEAFQFCVGCGELGEPDEPDDEDCDHERCV